MHKRILILTLFGIFNQLLCQNVVSIHFGVSENRPYAERVQVFPLGTLKLHEFPAFLNGGVTVTRKISALTSISIGLEYQESKYSGEWKDIPVGYIYVFQASGPKYLVGMSTDIKEKSFIVPLTFSIKPSTRYGFHVMAGISAHWVSQVIVSGISDGVEINELTVYRTDPEAVQIHSEGTSETNFSYMNRLDTPIVLGVGWRFLSYLPGVEINVLHIIGRSNISRGALYGLGKRHETNLRISYPIFL